MKIKLLALIAIVFLAATINSPLIAVPVSTNAIQAVPTASTTSTVTTHNIIAFDDFHRSDRPLLRDTLPTGQVWRVLSDVSHSSAFISNNMMVSDGDIYAYLRLNGTPARFGGKFSWTGDPGTPAGVTLNSGKGRILREMIFTYINPTGINPTWSNGTSQGNALTNCIGSPYFNPALSPNGVVYEVYISIAGDSIQFSGSNGLDYHCTDSHVGALSGPLLIWQITGNSTYNRSRFHEIEADN